MAVPHQIAISVAAAVILFFACQFVLVYREITSLDDQRAQLQSEIHVKERRLDELQQVLVAKERDIHRADLQLSEMEFRVKGARRSAKSERTTLLAPIIYCITPTYKRPTQRADLTRLAQTLMNIASLHWIIVEDAPEPSAWLKESLAERWAMRHTLLSVETPEEYRMNASTPHWRFPRGVQQRNLALKWLRKNISAKSRGVVYFADDDNAYDVRLFEEMRSTSIVSVWPVGLVGGLMVERPLVENGRVSGFLSAWKANRPFPIDMAGFAVNLRLILEHRTAEFSFDVLRGMQESMLLQQLSVSRSQLEPKADNCTKVFVWHTRTENPKLKNEARWKAQGKRSDDGIDV